MHATIFALSSGQPPAAIGVIRVSGPEAGAALVHLTGRLPEPRRATLAVVREGAGGLPLDSALVLWFPAPGTATGEDLAEIHCHGGRAVTVAIMRALATRPGLRLAEPGEFTRRAFENGRMDLNEAEGLADLLYAETEAQRQAAMAMAQGQFSRKLADWQNRILTLSALVEAALDFSDEDDVPDAGVEQDIARKIDALGGEVTAEAGRPSAERLREGIRVVIAGPPNAGKSTLLNALADREAAIVSDIAGTTRDLIEVPVSLMGVPFLLTDTAGLRDETSDAIEAIGMGRASEAVRLADIVLWLGAPWDAPRDDAVVVAAKADIAGGAMEAGSHLAVSAVSGLGIDTLTAKLKDMAANLMPREGEYALHRRQRTALEKLAATLSEAEKEPDLLVVAEHLRQMRLIIDALTGRSGTEDMLDALFGTFCIGK